MFSARRLVRTENTYVTNQAELDAYTETGIERYEYCAHLDERTSDICGELNQKTFLVKDAVPGENYPPMHPFCRSTTVAVMPTEAELDAKWDKQMRDVLPGGVSFEQWLDGLEKTEGGKLVYSGKAVDKSGESGIINYAKATDVFDLKNYSENSNINLQKVVDLLEQSDAGRTAMSQLSENGVKPIFDYSEVRSTNRGEQQGKTIKIYVRNIANERVAAQTVVHETTHLYYNIGQNQWAEAVCFAKEKLFLTGRPLTVAEKRYIVKLAKDNYPELKWKKGGYGYGK